MLNARQSLARIADGFGLLTLSAHLRRNSSRLVILAYHRVLNLGDEQAFGSDLELVSAGTDGFRDQMRFMQQHFDIITFRQLDEMRRKNVDLKRATAIVTFDDGFEDNYKNAFPILTSMGMPATIFLSTGYIDRNEAFWFEALAQAILGTRSTLSLPQWPGISAESSVAERRIAMNALFKQLKRQPNAERCKNVQRIIEMSGMQESIAADTVSRPLSWEQIGEMSRGGIEFGSHTVNHPVLAQMDETEIRSELAESKRRIEEKLGTEVTTLSYPVGGSNAFDERVRRIAAELGYRLAVSYQPGTNSPKNCDWFALRRAHVERYTTMQLFKAEVAIADLLPS